MHSPEIIFLDEPTSGLDPVSMRAIHKLILDRKKEEFAILLHQKKSLKMPLYTKTRTGNTPSSEAPLYFPCANPYGPFSLVNCPVSSESGVTPQHIHKFPYFRPGLLRLRDIEVCHLEHVEHALVDAEAHLDSLLPGLGCHRDGVT